MTDFFLLKLFSCVKIFFLITKKIVFQKNFSNFRRLKMLSITITINIDEKKNQEKKSVGTQTQTQIQEDDVVFIRKLPSHPTEWLKHKTTRLRR